LVSHGGTSFEIVEPRGASVAQEHLPSAVAMPSLAKRAIGYHNLSTLTHMQGQESEKHETVPRSAGFVCIPGPKDVLWFSNGTKDAHMRQFRLYLRPVSHSGSASQAKQWTGYGPLAWTIHRSNHNFPSGLVLDPSRACVGATTTQFVVGRTDDMILVEHSFSDAPTLSALHMNYC